MQRSISVWSLLFASVSAILGSGWLFSAYYAAQLAGPAGILSWVLGGVAMIIVAFVFAELSATIPVMGSSARIPQFTHGVLVGFLFSWMIWLSYAVLVSSEVQAIVQYSSLFFPRLIDQKHHITLLGYYFAVVLTLFLSVINIYSLRWLIRSNNILTLLKIIIPVFVSAVIIVYVYTPGRILHSASSHFMPMGWHGVMSAITTGGIIFAFNGFKQACELAGEAKNPHVALPIAIIGSVAICLVIYLLLQMAFLTSITPENITNSWQSLHFLGGQNSPFASVVIQNKLPLLLPILYVGAFIGPFAAGLMYVSSAGRSLHAMSANGYLPLSLQNLTTQGNPIYAILINFAVSLFLFAPLPGWDEMITFLSSLVAMTYGVAPVCLLALREQLPSQRRYFRLPFTQVWAWFAFYICTLMTYWSGWHIISQFCFAVVMGFAVLFLYRALSKRGQSFNLDWRASIWIWPYLAGLTLISWLGNFGGGKNIITFGMDFLLIGILTLFCLYLSQRYKLSATETQHYVMALGLPA